MVRITLGANISGVTKTAGTRANPFQGTFDGQGYTLGISISETSTQGTAPFREISGATIKRLTVTGSVTGTTHAAGLVGFARSGTNTIEDCNVSASVTVSTGSNKHCGGLVGHAVTSTLTIRNSIYSGTISSGDNFAGGLQGWSDGSTLNIENSLCSGTYTGSGKFHPIAVRNNNATMSGTVNGAYYTATPTLTTASLIAAEGTQAYTSRQSFPCKSATILGNAVYYAADLTPFGKTGSYTPDGTASNPYIISTTEGWNYFCDALQDNDTWNRFSGKTVVLANDITVTRMAGGSNHAFTGTFDGQGHTLTVNYGTADEPVNEEFVAPFVEVTGSAKFTNLNIGGTIYDGYTGNDAHNVAGLIGHLFGDVTIEHCVSRVEIHAKGGAGGFVGLCEHTAKFTDCLSSAVITSPGANNSGFVAWSRASGHAISFDGCTFNGKLLQQDGKGASNGGFIGWTGSNKTVTITNCLCAPATLADGETMASSNSATFARGWNATTTATNSYYTQSLGTAQGVFAYVYTPATVDFVPANVGAKGTAYSVSGITAYASGLKYNGKFYLVKADVTLADNADNSGSIIDNQVADVTLAGRTLYKDGKWNTLCLPFDVTISGSPLDGDNVDVRTLSSSEFDSSNGSLTLNFTAEGAVTKMEAGVPYIIKWDESGENLTESSLVFQGVTVESGLNNKTCDLGDGKSITFCGTISPEVIYESSTEKHNLYLGSANTLYYPTATDFTVKSCRAYFRLNGLTAGEPVSGGGSAGVRAFTLNFGDGEQTGIVSISKESGSEGVSDVWYTLDGMRLGSKPTQRGMYINNGKKVIIK